jgi:hypothetical protein
MPHNSYCNFLYGVPQPCEIAPNGMTECLVRMERRREFSTSSSSRQRTAHIYGVSPHQWTIAIQPPLLLGEVLPFSAV